jgi:tetratricopeptide (TPR) repeat protein
MRYSFNKKYFLIFILMVLVSCKMKDKKISGEDMKSLDLKRGGIVLCGPLDKQFGTVVFDDSCPERFKKDFNLAVALLHSFEYDEAEKQFVKIIDEDPECAMAYWGAAMCNYHPLWAPPSIIELKKGARLIELAGSRDRKSERESGYIEAMALFYKDWEKTDHHTRCVRYEKAMEKMFIKYPGDHEAAIFYALALDAAADPYDKTYVNQRKAGAILNAIYPDEPNHPGIVHYIIHTYDYPGLAELALPAARKYSAVAPASAHAQHMPSHIFTRLGLWNESIASNLNSTASARCYAENVGIKGHWDEELHGMDYLEYAYLQKAETGLARSLLDSLRNMDEVYPEDFKVAYAFAAIPARYLLENKRWKDAAVLAIQPAYFPWEKFPWQKAIFHFARVLGAVHIGKMDSARAELEKLNILHENLVKEKDLYQASQVEIQIREGHAWLEFKEGNNIKALEWMNSAADMEDATEKHPVSPGELIPARELLADMLLEMGETKKALEAYQEDLETHPNRFNGLYGAGLASQKSGDVIKAGMYFRQLSENSSAVSDRPELTAARIFLKNQQ